MHRSLRFFEVPSGEMSFRCVCAYGFKSAASHRHVPFYISESYNFPAVLQAVTSMFAFFTAIIEFLRRDKCALPVKIVVPQFLLIPPPINVFALHPTAVFFYLVYLYCKK